MDAGGANVCTRCGQPNPIHGLWCRQCGVRLSQPADSAVAALQQDKGLLANIELYGRVLEDLDGLVGRGEIPSAISDTIKGFYSDRLAQKRSQEETRSRAAALQKCVWAARSFAHSTTDRIQEALRTLDEGIKKFPEEKILQEMAQEIRTQTEKRERVLRAAKAARNLLAAAKTCLQESRFEEAEARLKDAQALDPDNKEIIATLGRVQGFLEEQRRQTQAPEPTAISEQTAIPKTTEAQAPVVRHPPAPASAPGHQIPSPGGRARAWAEKQQQVEPVSESLAALEAPIEWTTDDQTAAAPSFAEEEEAPSPAQRLIESASQWSKILKPFLVDNVGWFIGAFLIIAGFVVLITTFWQNIETNEILKFSLVYFSLVGTTGLFFALAYFMRVKHSELETSSNVLLIIVALLIPLVFAAAALTTLVP